MLALSIKRVRLWSVMFVLVCVLPVQAQVNVLTANYDAARTNANLDEEALNTAKVSSARFGRLYSLPVDGYIYAQPLFVSQLDVPGRGVHDVVFVATMHNSVYAFAADESKPTPPLWQVNLGSPVMSGYYGFTDIIPEVGILSTPVIDLESKTLYAMANVFDGQRSSYILHALDIASGAEKFGGPTVIDARVPGTGIDSLNGVITFNPDQQLQRPGLLLLGGVVYAAFGSHADQPPFHGWILGYDANDVGRQVSAWCSTPNGGAGSIWQSGRGLAALGGTALYTSTGNGDFDSVADWSQSFLRFDTLGGLALADWFTPFDWQATSNLDLDVGTSGVLIAPGGSIVIGGGKEGTLYVLDGTRMGHIQSGNSQIIQSFQAVTKGIFQMACWDGPGGLLLYLWGWNDPLKAFRMSDGMFETAPSSQNALISGSPYVGMAVSANHNISGTGILWVTTADSMDQPAPGVLHAFDAEDVSRELWNSHGNNGRDVLGNFAKFAVPTVANGRVYVPTFSGELAVYGIKEPRPFRRIKVKRI